MSEEFAFVPSGSSAKTVKLTEDAGTNPEGDTFFFLKPMPKKDERKKEDMAAAAGVGAAAGAGLRYKGVEARNIFKPGEGVFSSSQNRIDAINSVLRQRTGDPTIDVRGMTQAQVERILQGGEGSTMGTTGRQREAFNLETSRQARSQQQAESMVNKLFPGTPDPITSVGEPIVPLKGSDIHVPASTATQIEAQRAAGASKAVSEAQNMLRRNAALSGAGKIGSGALGGALAGAQTYSMAKQPQPADWTQYLSLLGNLGMTFGGPRLGVAGGLAQLPYAVKHREEIARGMGLGEINPTVFGGAPEALETPIKPLPVGQ